MFLSYWRNIVVILCFSLNQVLCLFDQCNHKVEMKAGEKLYLNSPYYPGKYPVGSSCRYVLKAPQDYELKFTCNIKLNTPQSATRCVNEVFYFNREGSEVLTGSEYFCGTGKMERKSFLNQAVLSYISTPYYKRILPNFVKESEEEIQRNKTSTTETKKQQQKRKMTTTTAKPTTTTSRPLNVNQVTTSSSIALPANLLTTSFTQAPLTETTTTYFLTSSDEDEKENIKETMQQEQQKEEDKNFTNSFAYVVALLSSKIDIKAFATKITTATQTTTKPPVTIATTSSKPTSVLNFYDFLPVNTWRNGSIATHKISTKRVAKVIIGQDYTSSKQTAFPPTPTHSPLFSHTTRNSQGGGSFSCLVEVLETQCECGWSSSLKIAGASGVAGINEFPSMAGVMTIKNQKIFCGATIIHHRYLLSAAHCYITPETSRPEYLTAVVGEHDLSTVLDSFYTRQYDLIKIILHEQFHATSTKVHNDIALLKTRYPIEWNRSVGPVCLPFYTLKEGSGTIPYAGQRVETAGWGTTSFGGQQSSVLLKTTLDVISRNECQNIVRNLPFGAFCTYTPGRDTCQYDSGGALYARGERLYAVGIVSYGFACATNQPSVNTRISSHLKWIRNKTPEAKYCTK
ncbi:transmembrane protease serine 9 [Lucilia cuprina]|uniref:transmembrane protease serine 9 n=1 Tax=Lucilia cuprina TaxID=7375 RepID=UPI001F06EC5A|nr:transmembrane protease serine 9 [Lucilia cuprina]